MEDPFNSYLLQVEFLSGLTGPAMDIRTLVEAVRSGTLYQLINFGPHYVIFLKERNKSINLLHFSTMDFRYLRQKLSTW